LATRKPTPRALPEGADPLYDGIRVVLAAARDGVHRAVNSAMVQAYWHVGRLIVEHEQDGDPHAAYGEAVLADLSRRLVAEFGPGFDETNLRKMRQFYRMFEIRDAARLESEDGKRAAPRRVSDGPPKRLPARPELTWSHFRSLMQVQDDRARRWYMDEAARDHWSTRQMYRQIAALYYERLLASPDKAPVREEARTKLARVQPAELLRDPYVLDFLGLPDTPALRESTLEQAIIDNLQAFLLELGRGFAFVARQKRLRFDDEDFYVDLVFYNYVLKCFVLVDLKVGRLTHQDIGQMDSYVRMFDAHARTEGDNPTIGLILCSARNEAIAKYSILAEAQQVFAAKYVQYLPSEEQLRAEVDRQRERFESAQAGATPKAGR
jgi:predicted nuclease of restriction endonuclease-like (RecB) superfamily